jgi:rhomboid protease GluP
VPIPLRWRWKLDRWREALRGTFRPQPRPSRPRLCPACGTLVGSTASKCHQCGASMTFSLAAASRSLSGLLPSESPVTYVVLTLNVLLFGVSLLASMRVTQQMNLMGGINGQVLDRLGASEPLPWLFANHQWWRLVMAIFLHGGVLHILMNTWVLMDIGPQVEEVYGSARYLFLYVATGAFGFLASSVTGHFSVGASGSLLGLVGLMLAITTRRGGNYMRMVRGQLLRWVAYILVFGLLFSGIDNTAHLGGLGAGFLLGKIMADREPADASERKRAYALGWLAGLTVAGSFAAMFIHNRLF